LGGVGVGFLTTLGVGVGFFCPTPNVQLDHFLKYTLKLGIPGVSLLGVHVDCFMTRWHLTGKRLRTPDVDNRHKTS